MQGGEAFQLLTEVSMLSKLIEEQCVYQTRTQISAFGPRHLISINNLS